MKTKLPSISQVIKEEQNLIKAKVNIGRCEDCHLKRTCVQANSTDNECRLVKTTIAEFYQEACNTPFIEFETDTLGVRALAALHGLMAVFEEYFNRFGVVQVTSHNIPKVSELTKEYIKLNALYQQQLAKFGLNPFGREQLRATIRGTMIKPEETLFAKYLDAKYKLKEADRHHRVLRGPATPQSLLQESASAESDLEVDLSIGDDHGGNAVAQETPGEYGFCPEA